MKRIITQCGAIIETASLNLPCEALGFTYCPLSCSACGKQHGYEIIKKVSEEA